MNRRFGWAMLVAVGIAIGFALGSYQRTNTGIWTASAVAGDTENEETQSVEQLKEIKAQLKEINGMFRTGTARVTVVINPAKP